MAWELVDSAETPDSRLDLYRKDSVFMVRTGGLELMNGFQHESETVFGRLAVELAEGPDPRILIGGLGLGYTLAAASAALGDRGHITVAEFSPAIIRWFETHVGPSVLPEPPANLTILEADVVAHLESGARYDVIALDIDNGPEPLVRPGNGALYAASGLQAMRRSLLPGGTVLLWSAFEAPVFEVRARESGFTVARRIVANGPRPELDHALYVLSS
jgi:spermidine synthase